MNRKKSLGSTVTLLTLLLYMFCLQPKASAEEMLTPESFVKHITLQPAITKLIEDDDLQSALKKVNILHGKMAEQGWELFGLIEFIDDEDFEGFFVTYKKKKE